MDLLTLTGLIASLIAIGIAFYAMWYSKHMVKERLKKIAMATLVLQGNHDEKMLCEAIREIDPHACPLLDYTIETKDGKVGISEWSAKGSQPTKEQLEQALLKLKDKLSAAL